MYDPDKNLRKFLVNSGELYYVINSEKCVNAETNLLLPLYFGEDEIEVEAEKYRKLTSGRLI
jgi:hypothetical protein